MSSWVPDALDAIYDIERHTTGGGVNLGCGLLLLACMIVLNARAWWFDVLNRVLWFANRILEYKSSVKLGQRYQAKPYPESDSPKIKLSGLFLLFAISCPITIVIANA